MKLRDEFGYKFIRPILKLLKQGTSPEKLSLSITSGAVIGVLPVIGTTTLLSAAIAFIFRLNLPIVQLINYMVYPLQLFFMIPFIHLGAFIFNAEPIPLSLQEVIFSFQHDFWATLVSFSDLFLYAVAAWLLLCLPVSIFLYSVVVFLLRRYKRAPHVAD